VGARDALLHFNGETWTDVGIQVSVRVIDIWGSSASDIWVTDGTNILWHYDGSTWRNIHSQLNHPFTNFWGIAPDNVFGVGDDGMVARYNGTTWSEQLLGNIFFRGIWGTSDTDVWASGVNRVGGGALFHFDGTDWTRASSDPNMGILRDVWNDEIGDHAFAVGTSGFLVSRIEGQWERVPTATKESLSAVWGAPTGEVFVAGEGGVCLHFDGVAWNELSLGANLQFTSIWGAARDDVYMGSNSGLWHFDGAVWSNIGVLGYVSGVWGTNAENIYITGNDESFERAYVSRFDGTTWHSIYSRESAYVAWPTETSRYDVVITIWLTSEQRSRLLGYRGAWWKDISPPGVSHLGPVGGNARLGLVVNGYNVDGNVIVDQSLLRLDGDRWESRSSPLFQAISDGFETGVYLVGDVHIVRGNLQ
jgi:hypothetical protein